MTDTNISMSNTKKEILEAYDALLEKLKAQKQEDPKYEKEQTKKAQIIKSAVSNSSDGIAENIAALKLHLGKSLDKIGDDLSAEFKRLTEIKEAISIEEKNLEDTFQLTKETESLAAVLQAQKVKKEEFEAEMAENKAKAENEILEKQSKFQAEIEQQKEKARKEREAFINKFEEEKADKLKQRKREQEDYEYKTALKQKKEQDAYEEMKAKQEKELAEKRSAFEKEIKEREQAVAENEAELIDLRKKAEKFPAEIEKSVKEAEKSLTEKLNSEFNFKIQLTKTETEGELKLKDRVIESLQDKIKDLENQIEALKSSTDKAESNAKEIVMKAIESTGSSRLFNDYRKVTEVKDKE